MLLDVTYDGTSGGSAAPALFVPETARNIRKQAVAILVERTVSQTTEVFLFL